MKRRSPMLIFIAILALVQGVLGVFRAFECFNIGADQLGQGVLILRLVGAVSFARGGLDCFGDAPSVVCCRHAPREKLGLGSSLAAISVLLVLNVVILGASVSRAAFWLIAPIVIASYLQSPSGRAAVKQINS